MYASCFTVKEAPSPLVSLTRGDIQFFMAALAGIGGDRLDVILHTPGGSAEAVEQIVNYLRQKFSDIRVIVPQNAMSAGTMLACAANTIVMGKHSALGPIDPQITIQTPTGPFTAAAQSLLDEFDSAKQAIAANPNAPDIPILVRRLTQYPPGFLIECQKAIDLSKQLVKKWLATYMLASRADKDTVANDIAAWLGTNANFLTHARAISASEALGRGLVVSMLEDDQKLQDAVLSVFHSTVNTFQATTCVKFGENHLGKGAFAMAQVTRQP
jgi:ClpP class serine protease